MAVGFVHSVIVEYRVTLQPDELYADLFFKDLKRHATLQPC